MTPNKINIDEVTNKCNEVITLAEKYRNLCDRLLEISSSCTPDVLSIEDDKIQNKIDEAAIALRDTYLQVLKTTTQVKIEAIKASREEEII